MDYAGKLLIATPSLLDDNFCQSVVLLIEGTDDDGVLGLILNRESDKPITELWTSLFKKGCKTTANLHVGGPVPGPLMSLHTVSGLGELEVLPGVFFSTSREALESIADGESEESFRFFIGNAGWGKEQLANEIKEGSWYLAEGAKELVFADETEIWQQLVELVGRCVLREMIQTETLPSDPNLN